MKINYIGIGIILLIIVIVAFSGCVQNQSNTSNQSGKLVDPKKTPHYESNIPAHGATLKEVPNNVTIYFNFDLGTGSKISILKDGKEYGTGETIIEPNKLSMSRSMDPNAPNGLYTVNYIACWPDGSCHDGMFQFTINKP